MQRISKKEVIMQLVNKAKYQQEVPDVVLSLLGAGQPVGS